MPYVMDAKPAPELDPGRTSSSGTSISSLLLSHFASADPDPGRRKGGVFSRGLGGCTVGAARKVSVPEAIRSPAKCQESGRWTKKKKKKGSVTLEVVAGEETPAGGNCMPAQDVWCGPGIGLSSAPDKVVGPVDRDCVVPRRGGRGKINGERERERERNRERSYCVARRAAVNPDILSLWDTDSSSVSSHREPELFGSRYRLHVRHPSPDGLAEMMMLRGGFMMGGRLDRFRDLRLDIDHMSHEQLLELGDRIGYVNTGLKENEISKCIMKLKLSVISRQSANLALIKEKKCSICQEEYEVDDELGKLGCGHGFHVQCIRQWIAHKNSCPVCKTPPVARG